MYVVKATARGVFFGAHRAMFTYGIGSHRNATKTNQTIGNTGDVNQTCGFEEGDFNAESGGDAGANTNGRAPVFFVIFFLGGDIFCANGHREHTIPFDIGKRVDELALAFSKKKGQKDAKQIDTCSSFC